MKKFLFFLIFLWCSGLWAFPARQNICSGSSENAGDITVIAAPGNLIASFAAGELCRLLKESGQSVQISDKPAGKTIIFLGDSPLSRQAGVIVRNLPEDGFRILKKGNHIFIAGKDTPEKTPFKDSSTTAWNYSKGTLYGTYEFLERFADIRFYFPGRMGTVVPRKALVLPQKICILDYPARQERSYLSHWSAGGKWYPGAEEYKDRNLSASLHATLRYRARFLSPHMSNSLHLGDYIRRFRQSHPEYFAVDKKGKLYCDTRRRHRTQICLSSRIKEEIFQDIKAFFSNQPPASRGLKKWEKRLFGNGYINLTHDDSFVWCACQKCSLIADESKLRNNPREQQKVSTACWSFVRDIALRMKKEGVPGKIIMLAYNPYDLVPECEIPDNVFPVVVVFPGPQGDHPMRRANDRLLNAWRAKTGGRLFVRTWPGKYMTRAIPDVPAFKHNYIAEYFSERKDWFAGTYMDEMCDRQIFRVLNLYVFMKMAWNPSLNGKVLIDEFFKRMFGPGAPFIRKYYDDMEEIWDKKIIKGTTSTNYGGRDIVAQYRELWEKIFNQKQIEIFDNCFDRAEKAAAGEPEALKRIRFMRKEIFLPLKKQWQKYQENQNCLDSWLITVPGKVHLRSRKGEGNEVKTLVTLSRTPEEFVFEADCEEPFMAQNAARVSGRDSGNAWHDSTFEVFLNPSGDRKNYYQWVVNANGALDDYHHIVNGNSPGIKWNSRATVRVSKKERSWKVTLRIPKKDLGNFSAAGFPALFVRHRALTQKIVKEKYYYWHPMNNAKFMVPDKWGMLIPDSSCGPVSRNLVRDPGFSRTDVNDYRQLSKKLQKGTQSVALDDTTFITGGKSLLLSSSIQKSMHADVPVYGILPGKKYRLSFFCRLENVKGEGLDVSLYCGPGKGLSPMARRRLKGTLPWHRLVFELDIPESYDARKKAVIFTLRRATGKVWVDHLQIEEISAQPLARVGIITDTHVKTDIKSCAVLEKAFRLFKKHKVDMIVNCGDIADRHREKAYQNYRATVKKVYPSGKPKELFAFANHDILDVATRENAMTKAWPLLKKRLEIEHDCYSKHYLAGCIFLTAPQIANWSVYEKMISDACKETPGKPVFLVDHVPAADTTFDTKTWGYAASRKIFNKYPQIVQLSGHVHGTLRNEQNIWQGEFTVVNAGCTGQFWGGGLIGTPPPERWSEDALIMEIWSQKLVFRRFDLKSGKEYRQGTPWCIPLPFDSRTAPYTSWQRKKLPPPEFAPQSRIVFSTDQLPCNQLRVSFPDARGKDGTYIYRITLFEKQNNQWKRFSNFEVSGSYLKEENKRTQTLLKLSAAYFESGKEYRIQIDPVDFFGNTGKALCGEFTMPQKRKWQTVFESDDPGKECAFLSGLSGGQPLKRKGGFFQHDVWEARLVFPGNVWQAPAGTRFRFTVDLHMKQPSPEKQWTLVLRNPVPPANANVRISTPSGDSGLQRYVIEFAKARDFYNYYLLIREGKTGEIKFHHIKIEKFVEKEKQKCK